MLDQNKKLGETEQHVVAEMLGSGGSLGSSEGHSGHGSSERAEKEKAGGVHHHGAGHEDTSEHLSSSSGERKEGSVSGSHSSSGAVAETHGHAAALAAVPAGHSLDEKGGLYLCPSGKFSKT